MSYLIEANGALHISERTIHNISITLQTLCALNSPKIINTKQRLIYLHKILFKAHNQLSEILFIHNSMQDPDDQIISSVIRHTGIVNELLYEIDNILNSPTFG